MNSLFLNDYSLGEEGQRTVWFSFLKHQLAEVFFYLWLHMSFNYEFSFSLKPLNILIWINLLLTFSWQYIRELKEACRLLMHISIPISVYVTLFKSLQWMKWLGLLVNTVSILSYCTSDIKRYHDRFHTNTFYVVEVNVGN